MLLRSVKIRLKANGRAENSKDKSKQYDFQFTHWHSAQPQLRLPAIDNPSRQLEFSAIFEFNLKNIVKLILTKIIVDGGYMNWDIVEGNWKQLKGKIKEEWGKLNDNHLDKIGGIRDQVTGKKQEMRGTDKVKVDNQIKANKQATKDDFH